MTTNPFRKVEKAVSLIGDIVLYTIMGALVFAVFIIYPIFAFIDGRPWYDALAAWLVTIGLILIVLFIAFVIVPLWDKFVGKPWADRKAEWDRAQWQRDDLLPLDPEPYLDYDEDAKLSKRFATDEGGWRVFRPREGYNPHMYAYRSYDV